MVQTNATVVVRIKCEFLLKFKENSFIVSRIFL